jgi:hypothetical protein
MLCLGFVHHKIRCQYHYFQNSILEGFLDGDGDPFDAYPLPIKKPTQLPSRLMSSAKHLVPAPLTPSPTPLNLASLTQLQTQTMSPYDATKNLSASAAGEKTSQTPPTHATVSSSP